MGLIKLAAAGAAGYAFYKYATREKTEHAAFAASQNGTVRDAGPQAMRDEPRRWQKTDEESDESFPASDPPANY
ncbi:hypothetical protein GCM10011371_16230 [Novosphingobium marinum]|uniref:Uncharacterized protein n=1 Tax=Novosphingobium marinum TaxID=1514948 RepID=A0A7Z0BW09_9SPHN|nr:hypothetical protein [Novosphingobium marinum]NYH95737.1 hypothetical protein [Novosphingobium marinum]GGC29435.1 hypothetical protein GCM10011371_16230 [Novosphingobium marinum]